MVLLQVCMQVTHNILLNGKRTLGDHKKDEPTVSSGTKSSPQVATRRVPIQGHCNAMPQHTGHGDRYPAPDAVGGRLHLLVITGHAISFWFAVAKSKTPLVYRSSWLLHVGLMHGNAQSISSTPWFSPTYQSATASAIVLLPSLREMGECQVAPNGVWQWLKHESMNSPQPLLC